MDFLKSDTVTPTALAASKMMATKKPTPPAVVGCTHATARMAKALPMNVRTTCFCMRKSRPIRVVHERMRHNDLSASAPGLVTLAIRPVSALL